MLLVCRSGRATSRTAIIVPMGGAGGNDNIAALAPPVSSRVEPEPECTVKRRSAGQLEGEVMNALWDAEGWMTPRDVRAIVSTSRRPLAYNTVMTILVRLWQKGMVDRRLSGRSFEYRPRSGREEWTATRMQELLHTAADPALTLQHFVSGITSREATALRRFLDGPTRS
jgi:predicted transcriptional regulator